MSIQLKTARLTVLLDPTRKQAFESACRGNDMTPSQVLRHLIRDFVTEEAARTSSGQPARKAAPATRAAPASARRVNSRQG